MRKWIWWSIVLLLAGFLLAGFDQRLTLTEYTVSGTRIPDGFDGYRIAVVSDLHGERFGRGQQELLEMLQKAGCDLVCLTGDVVSHDTEDFSPVWELIEGLGSTPVVYVAGNNELSLDGYGQFLEELASRGVTVLDDMGQRSLTLTRGGDSILMHGLPFTDSRHISDRLSVAENGYYNILLYHDPWCFPEAALMDYDLMLSGHVHGGVVRLPLLGSPLEWMGVEPYTKGIYTSRAATLVVSGGLGEHETLPRFYNRPEVVVVTLMSQNP